MFNDSFVLICNNAGSSVERSRCAAGEQEVREADHRAEQGAAKAKAGQFYTDMNASLTENQE